MEEDVLPMIRIVFWAETQNPCEKDWNWEDAVCTNVKFIFSEEQNN